MKFQVLDPKLITKALEGHVDVLSQKVAEENAFLDKIRCPICSGSTIAKEINKDRPFVSGSPTQNFNCRCSDCNCLFSPNTLLIISS